MLVELYLEEDKMKILTILSIIVMVLGITGAYYYFEEHTQSSPIIKNTIYTEIEGIQKPVGVQETIERGLTWDKICEGNICTLEQHTKPINYLEGDSYTPIDQTFIPSTNPNYDWMLESGIYQVYFKENPQEDHALKFYFKKQVLGYNITFWLDPYALIWRNANDQKQLINFAQNITGYPTQSYWLEPYGELDENGHPEGHIIHNDTDTFIYPDIFGYGTNLTFEYDNIRLKKRLYVIPEDLPYPTIDHQGLTLDLIFKVDIPDKAKLWIKNNMWNGETIEWNNRETIEWNNSVAIKVKNKTMAYLSVPYGREAFHWVDNNTPQQRQLRLKYEFKIIEQELYITVRSPAKYLANQSYIRPIEIDPSIQVDVSNSDDDASSEGINCNTFDYTDDDYYIANSVKPLGCTTIPHGIIFDGVNLDNSITVTDAYIRFYGWATCSGGLCKVNLYGVNDSDIINWNPSFAPKDATKTINYTFYQTGWDCIYNGVYCSWDINATNITIELLNHPDWDSGDNMGFVTNDAGTTGRNLRLKWYTWDHVSNPESELHITYTEAEEEDCWTYDSGNGWYFIPSGCECWCNHSLSILNLSLCNCYTV
jgi:hypothetical protein